MSEQDFVDESSDEQSVEVHLNRGVVLKLKAAILLRYFETLRTAEEVPEDLEQLSREITIILNTQRDFSAPVRVPLNDRKIGLIAEILAPEAVGELLRDLASRSYWYPGIPSLMERTAADTAMYSGVLIPVLDAYVASGGMDSFSLRNKFLPYSDAGQGAVG